MTNHETIAKMKVSDILRSKGYEETPVNAHIVPARDYSGPDYDAMRRVVTGQPETPDEAVPRE